MVQSIDVTKIDMILFCDMRMPNLHSLHVIGMVCASENFLVFWILPTIQNQDFGPLQIPGDGRSLPLE